MIEYAILLCEDALTCNRLATLLSFCVDKQLTVPAEKILPRRQLVLVPPTFQTSLRQLTPNSFDSRAREQNWIKDVEGSPADFVHTGGERGFPTYSMCSSTIEDGPAFLKQLGISEHQRIFFQTTDAQGSPVVLALRGKLKQVQWASTLNKGVAFDLSKDTVFLLRKAFFLLKERQDYLFSQSIQGQPGLSGVTSAIQDKTMIYHQQYQDCLSKDSRSTKLHAISLPQQETDEDGGRGTPATSPQNSEVRLVLARPHHVNGRIRPSSTKFFDVGSACLTEPQPGGKMVTTR